MSGRGSECGLRLQAHACAAPPFELVGEVGARRQPVDDRRRRRHDTVASADRAFASAQQR
jgi:hypothetical protein